MTTRRSETPLMVVDTQNGFVNHHSESALRGIVALIELWRTLRRPIFLSQFVNPPGSQWDRLLGWSRLRDAPETDLHDQVLKALGEDGTVFTKTSYTCVTGPFAEHLAAHRPEEVVVCGIATDGCVLKTAVDLFELPGPPIRPIVVFDACASQAGPDIHEKGLHLITRFIGKSQVISVEDVWQCGPVSRLT